MYYHHIKVTINTPEKAPYFKGSMLRGAMGYALKKVVCINPSYQCEGCFAQENCLYYTFYEAKNMPHAYRFDIVLGEDTYDFGLYLFEDACTKLPYVLSAIHKMLTKQGLGKDNKTIKDFTITVNNQEVYREDAFKNLNTLEPKLMEVECLLPQKQNLLIKLKTPLRIKKNNCFLKDDVDVEDILRSIHQRYTELTTGEPYAKLYRTPNYTLILKKLEHKILIRKSNRQKSTMNMDGVMGELVLNNIDEKSYNLLKLGEIIGVGKQTVLGLGKIEVEEF